MTSRAILIAGPTASGKSALALDLGARLSPDGGAVIVNADSMQVYRELRILTARPSAEDEARSPHRLYGVILAAEACSAMHWRELAMAEIRRAWAEGRTPIVVGGTGLYFRALIEGLAPVPDIPKGVREAARARHAELGAAALHAELAERDPAMAAKLHPGDSQRLIRAWEVIEATGVSLAEWQAGPAEAEAFEGRYLAFKLRVPRTELYARIDGRFLGMMEHGALAEVRSLADQGLDPGLPAMKAVGVPELLAHIRGPTGLEEAIEAAQRAGRRLAKRQTTWLRHQAADWRELDAQHLESLSDQIFPKIRQFLLTSPN